jgi:subtilisin family serine protease
MRLLLCILFLCSVVVADLSSLHASTKSKRDPSEVPHPRLWVIKLKDGVKPEDVAEAHNLSYDGPVGGLKHFHLFSMHPETSRKRHHAHVEDALERDVEVTIFEAQYPKRRFKRDMRTISDPLYSRQWHLHDIRADSAWVKRTGKGVNIAIVDDGVQWSHPDLQERYKAALSKDLNDHDLDPNPSRSDGHGTSAAGAALASSNNVCGVGVAPEAGLVGIRLIAAPVADYEEAQGLSYKSNQIHIYSSSWGPYDDASSLEGPGTVTKEMFQMEAVNGRNGLGPIWVWAGGNGRDNGDNCNYDGYANSRFTLAIGALDHRERQAWYSESCAALIACAPSSGASGYGITTTDLMGRAGYNKYGDCTSSFGGTSAAAPIAAGGIALLLEERPDLSWRDVQHIVAKSSRKVDASDSDWNTNDRGYHHNHKYGFGVIDTSEMLKVAKDYELVPKQQKMCTTGRIQIARGIADTNTWLDVSTTLPSYHCRGDLREIGFVEHVELTVYITHPKRGHVSINLRGPDGTISVLAEKHNDIHRNYPSKGWTFTSMRHFGSSMTGPWTINLKDSVMDGRHGKFMWYELKVYGY